MCSAPFNQLGQRANDLLVFDIEVHDPRLRNSIQQFIQRAQRFSPGGDLRELFIGALAKFAGGIGNPI
ncbi:hypothetical protein D3C73_1448080 [compost metagenome]